MTEMSGSGYGWSKSIGMSKPPCHLRNKRKLPLPRERAHIASRYDQDPERIKHFLN